MTHRQVAWARGAMLAAAILPIVVAVARALAQHWFPIGDNALLYIRVVDVGTHHHPWLGSWTSASLSVGENMNNPGPIYQDLAAPFAKFLSPGPGAAVAVGSINAATVVAISAAARRIGGWRFEQWALLATVALAWTMGSELLIDIWQAHALLIPFMLMLVLLVGLAAGQAWTLFWSLAVGSVLLQTHISYAYILAVLVPAAVISLLLVRRARPHRPWREALRSRRVLVGSVALVAIWAQPLIEQFFGPGKGNLSRLASNAGGGDLQVGLRQAMGIGAKVYALPPWWMRSGFSTSVPNTPLTGTPDQPQIVIPNLPGVVVSALCLLAVAAVLALGIVRNRGTERDLLARASMLALVATVGSVLAVANLTVGPVGLSAHHVRLLWPLAVFIHATMLAIAVAEFSRLDWAWFPRATEFALTGLAVLLGVLAVPYDAQPQGPVADYATMSTMRRIMPQIASLAAVQPVFYDTANLRPFEPYSSTMMMTMQDMGIEFRVKDEGMIRQLGEGRRLDGTEQARVFQLQGPQALLYSGTACRIAIASQLSPADEDVAIANSDRLIEMLVAGSIDVDPAELERAGPDLAADFEAARAGDRDAAHRLVNAGFLSAWYFRGAVDAADDPGDLLPVLDRYIDTVYALYSEQSAPCPG
ncbi:MAG: hypothetical protein ACOYMR_01525 [Ilumatobacteraceae bacterium]